MPAWDLAQSTLAEVRDSTYEVAVLPFGATEPHNLHLPYGTDAFEGDIVGREACSRADAAGARVVLLPTIPYGTQTNMRGFPLAMNLYPSTLTQVVQDLLESIVGSGIRKVLLLNMHGGNELKATLRELRPRTEAALFLCNWWEVLGTEYATIFSRPEDHAGELETSIGLAYFPHLVKRGADDGAVRPFRFEALNRGWVRTSREWHLLTTNAGSGNPHAASAQKGRQALDLIAQRIADFLVQLSNDPMDATFPFASA